MVTECASCGTDFEAKTRRAKYCSGKCKKRAADRRRGQPMGRVVQLPTAADVPASHDGIGAALIARFTADDLATPTGQIAVKVAADIDTMPAGTPGYAALVRELRAVVADLEAAAAPKKANPLVLLRERHARERASG